MTMTTSWTRRRLPRSTRRSEHLTTSQQQQAPVSPLVPALSLAALIAVLSLETPALGQWMSQRQPLIASMAGTRLAQMADVLRDAQTEAMAGHAPEAVE